MCTICFSQNDIKITTAPISTDKSYSILKLNPLHQSNMVDKGKAFVRHTASRELKIATNFTHEVNYSMS